MRSCGGPLASAWQWATPGKPNERLEDNDYRLTARHLLGQAVAPDAATCRNKKRTGANTGQLCGESLCRLAHHAHRCARGGGLVARGGAVEGTLAAIHGECGHDVKRQVHVPSWDRWRHHCPSCNRRGWTWTPPAALCDACGQPQEAQREEAILDLEVRTTAVPRAYFDVTVHHSVPGDAARLATASNLDGAFNREAEGEKCHRYPDGHTPWRVVPFALETYGRLGRSALAHLRRLARDRASNLEEGGDAAASALVARWGARLSTALHRANAAKIKHALGTQDVVAGLRVELVADAAS